MISLFIGLIFLILGLIFLVWGWYKKPKGPLKIDLRIPSVKVQLMPYGNIPLGIDFLSFAIFIFLYPLSPLMAYIIAGMGIITSFVIYFNYFRGK